MNHFGMHDALTPHDQECMEAVRRYLLQRGRSLEYRRLQCRRFRQLVRQGFPMQSFWAAADVETAERLALDWLHIQEEGNAAAGVPPRRPGAVSNYKKLINIMAKAAGHRGFEPLSYSGPRRILRLSLSPDQLDHVLDDYQHPDPRHQLRNLAVFAASVALATRRGEVSRLDLDHLDVDEGRIWVQASKNRVEGWMPVEDDVWPYLQAWLNVRPDPEDPLGRRAIFTTLRRPYRRLAGAGVYKALKDIEARTGVQVHNNVLRHTRNKRLKQHGHHPDLRRWILRHTDERALRHYDEQDYQDIRDQFQRLGGPGLRGDPRARGSTCPTCGQGWPARTADGGA